MFSVLRYDGGLVLVYIPEDTVNVEKFVLFSAATVPWSELRRFDAAFQHVAYDLYEKILMGVVGPGEIATFWSC